MASPAEQEPRAAAIKNSVRESLYGGETNLTDTASQVITLGAELADLISQEAGQSFPTANFHSQTSQRLISEFEGKHFDFAPAADKKVPPSDNTGRLISYLDQFEKDQGARLPEITHRMLDGGSYVDGYFDSGAGNTPIAKTSNSIFEAIQAIESNHPQAEIVREAIAYARFNAVINEYVRERIEVVAHPGRVVEFLPKRQRSSADVEQFWRHALIGNRDVPGILPAHRLAKRYFYEMKSRLESIEDVDSDFMLAAIQTCIYLKTSASRKSGETLRQPLLEALISVKQTSIEKVLEAIIDSEPHVISLPIGRFFNMTDEEFRDLQIQSANAKAEGQALRKEVIERKKDRDLLERELSALDESSKAVSAFFQSIVGKTYIASDGSEIVRPLGVVSNISSKLASIKIEYIMDNSDDPDAPLLSGLSKKRASFILHKIMTGEWIEA